VDDIKSPEGYDIVTTDSGVYAPELHDAKFICGAREWVPALVARARELEQREVMRMLKSDLMASTLEKARAEEREACARLCETHDTSMARMGGGLYDSDRQAMKHRGNELASAIRARRP
jgi:hypothetical protein